MFEHYQQRVNETMSSGGDLTAAEELLDSAPDLDDEQRAALWLYAWSLQSRAHQRYEIKRTMRMMAAARQPPVATE
jgi:hypothetical protein